MGINGLRNERGSMIPWSDITEEYLQGVDTVNYSELPRLKICPTILDYVVEDVVHHLKSRRPRNYIRERINRHILWDLSNRRVEGDKAIFVKFFGQHLWEHSAILQYMENKRTPGKVNERGLQLEHNNERAWYTEQLQSLDPQDPWLERKVAKLLATTTCTVVTPQLHKQLPNAQTDPSDPFIRYRELEPNLYWIDWTRKSNRWCITRIRKIIY